MYDLECQRVLNAIDRYLRDHNFETAYAHIGSLGFGTYDVTIRRRTTEASRRLRDIDKHPWPTIQAQLDILIYNFESKERKMKNIAFDISRDGPVGKLVVKDNVYDVCVKEIDCKGTPYNETTTLKVEVTGKNLLEPKLTEETRKFVKDTINNMYGALGITTTYNPDRKGSINEGKLQIKDVIFNPPATIVLWSDGSKTVVKAEHEVYDPEKGLAMAISKRAMGNRGNYFDTFKKYVDAYMKKREEETLAKIAALRNSPNTAYTDGTERIAESKKPYKIWYETESGVGSFKVRDYVRAGNAINAAKKMFAGMTTKWMVSQENPWTSGVWDKAFGSDS